MRFVPLRGLKFSKTPLEIPLEGSLSLSIDMLHNIREFSSLQSWSRYDWKRENGCTSTQSKRY